MVRKAWLLLVVSTLLYGVPQEDGVEDQASLRIMSYNIRREGPEKRDDRLWHNRLPHIVALWKRISPDVVGLQEVIAHQQEDLQKEFPHFTIIGQSRGSSWFGLATDEATPIAYKKDRYELQEQGTFSISAQSDSWFGWMPWHRAQTGLLPRVCTWAKLKDKNTQKEFYVYNTHLDHMYGQARELSAQKVMDDIANRTAGYPVIVTGDFNTPIEGTVKAIVSGSFEHAKDKATYVQGPRETSTGWESKDLKEIDHILVNKCITAVKSYCVIQSNGYPSDHRPVVAEIQL